MSTELRPGYKQTEVGVIPCDWCVRQIIDVCGFIVPGRNKPNFLGGTIPWITTPDLVDGGSVFESRIGLVVSKEQAEKVGSRVVPPGSVVMSCVGELGIVAYAEREIVINQQLHAFVPTDQTDAHFLLHAIKTRKPYLESIATKTALPYLNKANCNSIHLPFPPLCEQRAIAAALSDVDALLAKLDALIAKKRDLKQAAMQQLLTGQTRLPGFSGAWQVKQFGEVAAPRKDRVDPRKAGVQQFCVELEHIGQGTGQLVGSNSTGEESSLKSVFYTGDVLFGKLRAYLRKYWLADRCGVCSTEIWGLVANRSCVSPEFLFQFVTTDEFIESASTAYGTHMPRSDWNVVKNYEVALPKIAEQTAIATVLSDMDAEIAALEARRDKTRALKQGMMQELLTGRIRLV